MSITTISLIILGIFFLWFIFGYNGFIRLVNQAKEAWADIDVQLKRRYDLIPNLVETVKGYATHEKEVFENLAKARVAAMGVSAQAGVGNLADKGAAESMLADALKSVFAIAEAYPELKANQNFLSLQSELSDTENKIQAARRFFNANVRDLNIIIDSFPSNIIAKLFKFSKMEFFELAEGDVAAKEPVQVKF